MKNIKPLTFPFNSENNTSIKQSLFRFREYFDSSTIVGLGENAHFIKEFFTFRHQVIEFLVTECDFDTLAFEFGFSEGLEVGKSSVSCPLKPSDSAPLKHSTMPP